MIQYVETSGQAGNPYVDGFVEAYKEAFSGPPYYENYTTEEVMGEIWEPHARDGIIVLALADPEGVVGFGCTIPVPKAPEDVRDFLTDRTEDGSLPIDARQAWYMSELGVITSFRGHGIAYGLVKRRLELIQLRGGDHYIMRTAADGSNSEHLYQKLGSDTLAASQDISGSDQVTEKGSQSTARKYLYGKCATALANLP